jgi:maltokinase
VTSGELAALAAQLSDLLPGHMARQRWFGAKHRATEIRVLSVEELAPAWPMVLRVVVASAGGPPEGGSPEARSPEAGSPKGGSPEAASPEAGERYQLILGLRPAHETGPSSFGETAGVGELTVEAGPAFCFDGLVDPEVGLILLRHVAPSQEAGSVRPIGAEQSNTSLVYDETLILKVFRRLTGANPEIEVTLGLSGVGFRNVAEPLAVWRTNGDDLAVLQRFLPGAAEGWALAVASIRSVLDEAVDPAAAGGDLAPEVERLGVVTAEMHLSLAEAFGSEPGDAGRWVDDALARAASVRHPDLDMAAVTAGVGRCRGLDDVGSMIRTHGDYHLGQVMRTDDGWYVLDFEGEPSRPVEERRRLSSPLRDVAGMLRSIDYAAAVGRREHASSPADEALAASWQERNRSAFLTAYLDRLSGSALLPSDPAATAAVLSLFELDKAVYEVAYEQAHRPDWVQIPLDAVRRIIDARAARS